MQVTKDSSQNFMGLDQASIDIAFVAVGYALSSSCLVVINKWALITWPYSTTLTFLQLTVSWMAAMAAGKMGLVEVDALRWSKIKAFAPACLIFFIAIACNMKLLQHANVDTFIVLRSCVPLLTRLAESAFFGTSLPSQRVLGTLALIILGAIGYVMIDEDFSITAYYWGLAYIASMVTDTLLVKKVVTEVELTPWGLVLYNNFIASLLYPLFCFSTGEYKEVTVALSHLIDGTTDYGPVLASCAFGIMISYFGMNARKKLRATSFSVLGVICKFATVVVNTLAWDYHASPAGIGFMCMSLMGGIAYQKVVSAEHAAKR